MNIDENISKIIAKYIIGTINPDETIILSEWLLDADNKRMFEKIVDKNRVIDELSKLELIDSHKFYREFEKETKRRFSINYFFKYAAVIVLPIVLAIVVFYISKQNYGLKDESIKFTAINSGEITLIDEFDNHHILAGKDTTLRLSQYDLFLQNNYIKYRKDSIKANTRPSYNTISIPAGASYKLELSDGTLVYLNSETTLRYPIRFVGDVRSIELISGEAYFEVSHNEKKPFIVNFGSNQVMVLGTQFNVYSYPNEKLNVTLVRGKVSLNSSKSKRIVLKPGENASWKDNTKDILVNKVDVKKYISWKDGYMYFEKDRLEDIMTKLHRWYDFNVFYKDNSVRNFTFKMRADKNANFNTIVDRLRETGRIIIEEKGKDIIISNVIR